MAVQCPECATPVGDEPWCGQCGAHLVEVEPAGRSPRRALTFAAVGSLVLGLLGVTVWWSGQSSDAGAGTGLAAPTVPVEEQEILPPEAPPAPGRFQRQFAAEGRVVSERPRGDEPPPAPADDLVFTSATGSVDVDVEGVVLRGLVDGVVAWEREFATALAAPPVRSGTSILVLLADGAVVSLDPDDGTSWWERTLDGVPTAVASDGTLLLVGTDDGRVLRLDPDGAVVTTTHLGPGAVEAIVVGRPATIVLPDRLVDLAVDG